MAARLMMFARAFFVLCLFNSAFSQSSPFPSIDDVELVSYTTEVQLAVVKEAATVYVTEYYYSTEKRGSVKVYFQGELQSIYYDNMTQEILEVNNTYCKAKDVYLSDYASIPLYHGWLNSYPLVIGPSAPLFYAQNRKNDIVSAGVETVRDIPCDRFDLPVKNSLDNYTIQYYFAPEDWTTPYKYKNLRIPIRIRIVGKSSRFTGRDDLFTDVDQISDFAYFKPFITDVNELQPPIGIGCQSRKKTDYMPSISDTFQYSSEVVDLLQVDEHDNLEVQFERVFYDHPRLLARLDRYTKQKGYRSVLYDFNAGAEYVMLNDGTCHMDALRDVEFEVYDLGMSGRMMEPKEVLNLDGDFYEMGKREIRGIKCDTFESVETDGHFQGKLYDRLVVTAYFIESYTTVGVSGEMESRIPAYIIVNGWNAEQKKTLSKQINIYEFDDVIWPEMYATFRLERCYTKPESKAYFVLMIEVESKDAAKMEEQDDEIVRQLRSQIVKHAKIPDLRIPYLKVDYKTTGVFATGVMLERPPALIQFYPLETKPTITIDPYLKVIVEAETLEECSYACVDEYDFTCKGFYFCGRDCFLKSTDPFEKVDKPVTKDLGTCSEYIRTERESTNFRESYLDQAMENLEIAVLNESMPVRFQIPNGEEIVTVRDIVLGDGPYTGVDAGDKPFTISVELRKLDAGLETVQTADYAETLHECYKRCKEAGSACSSFSFCPDTPKDNKECLISSELIIKDLTKDTEMKPDKYCNIYNLKFADYFTAYPEKTSLLPGDKSIRNVLSIENCAQNCRLEKGFVCRGFEYCRSKRTCTLHKKHILELKSGETASSSGQCVHYAARYIADYMDMGATLIDDKSNVRYGTSLEECAKLCSEELKENCKSFNYCPSVDFGETSCSMSKKLLRDDGITTTEKKKCLHYEKRSVVHDWDTSKANQLSKSGYTKKGFTGLVVGMLAVGLIVGVLGFILYSYIRSRSSDEGMAVRFMKNET